jgi:hypothetical protein
MKNTGGSEIPFRTKTLRVETFKANDLDKKGRPEWREIAYGPVFKEHAWIESQETISDDVLIPTPEFDSGVVAVRVTCKVWEDPERRRVSKRERREDQKEKKNKGGKIEKGEKEKRRGGGIQWTAKSIIPLGIESETKEGADERAET